MLFKLNNRHTTAVMCISTGFNLFVFMLLGDQYLNAGGATQYGAALERAFLYFNNKADNETVSGQQRGELMVDQST